MYTPSFKPSLKTSASGSSVSGHDELSARDLSTATITLSEKIATGRYYRYFVENITDGTITEVTQAVYKKELYSNRLYRGYEIFWDSTSPILDYTQQEYTRLGSNSRNVLTVKNNLILFNYLASKGELIVENLNTSGNQYQTKDGKKYIGPFHIHPTEGPLTEAVHTPGPHRKLYDLGIRLTPYLTDTVQVAGKVYTELKNNQNKEAVV